MGDALLAGLQVVDLAGEPAQLTGRILADLGADVVKIEGPAGDPLRLAPPFAPDGTSLRYAAWNAGKTSLVLSDDELTRLLQNVDVVLDTPGWPGARAVDPSVAPGAVWVRITPFGMAGPRSGWRASDLGVMAASGNLYVTGDPDRPPVRCSEPAGYAHAGPEGAMAALTALASGRPQIVDVSMAEAVCVANMGSAGRYFRSHFAGRRTGEATGRTREIWPCADGFISFGLRGGRARVPNLELITRLVAEAGLEGSGALLGRDWPSYDPNVLEDHELRAIEAPIAAYFETRTMAALYELACETNLMLAPANSPRELYASAQLAARGFFADVGGVRGLPVACAQVRSADGEVAAVGPRSGPPAKGAGPPVRSSSPAGVARRAGPRPAWDGVKILEFGSGAAGPIATRFFAEHGATVVRIESKGRPDFLRVYALGPKNPHGLEGADMFDALNVGKRDVTLNLKNPEGVALAKRLVRWADAVAENFAPKAMRGLGLDYDSLVDGKPDLVMISACLQGQTGPHRNYPGFGGQGSALAGFNWLTGWPDRSPIGPSGTITDSLAPRYVAALLAAGLLYRRRTGRGVYIDVSQVEVAVYSLAPWLLDYAANGRVTARNGNRNERAAPHGVFPCQGDDRWVAVAVWTDAEWASLAAEVGIVDAGLATHRQRQARVDDVEALVAAWTSQRDRDEVASLLQSRGIEAVPVADFADVFADPQLAHREHFVRLVHPFMGEGAYERNGFRLSDAPSGYDRAGPTLGQDNEEILCGALGISDAELAELVERGVVS
jgi:crotonobetainyl-CoA:carnitine CoA-transferase CaiB-like acyl-CoA transferase